MPETREALTDRMADAIRFLSLDAIEPAGDGHSGAPLGCAEIAVALFTRHLKCNPADPEWPDRDRFVLSNGHGSMLLYAALHLAGYAGLPMERIRRFRELGSHTHGHPEIAPELGIEATTGPLGQGIANAVGMAVAEAKLAATFGPDLVDHRTYPLRLGPLNRRDGRLRRHDRLRRVRGAGSPISPLRHHRRGGGGGGAGASDLGRLRRSDHPGAAGAHDARALLGIATVGDALQRTFEAVRNLAEERTLGAKTNEIREGRHRA